MCVLRPNSLTKFLMVLHVFPETKPVGRSVSVQKKKDIVLLLLLPHIIGPETCDPDLCEW